MNHNNRREFFRQLAKGSVAIGAGASMAALPDAYAQSSGYRALVCLFLFGGNDGLNTIIPLNDSVASSTYSQYAAVRRSLAISQSSLVPLNGTRFGLHPSLAPLQAIWNDNAMAVVHNVGPLPRPTTQAQFVQWRALNDSAYVPESLFSHSDQQRQWENGQTVSISPVGWGGLAAEQLDSRQVISFGGNTRFGGTTRGNELVLPGPGSLFGLNGYGNGSQSNARRAALEALLADGANGIHTVLSGQHRSALTLSSRLEALVRSKPGDAGSNPLINQAFGNLAAPLNSNLAGQLYQVAKMVEQNGRATLGGTRHIFFVSLGGFDTHANQLGAHADLLADVGRSVAAFYNAMKALGMADQVTLFTASDFGRTFKPNNSAGTDHAWGNEQIVIGAGVNPRALVGRYPTLALGSIDDAADPTKPWEFQGRWIPTISVTQYAGALLRWLSPSMNLLTPLPGLSAFGGAAGANIGLMKA